eukprot:4994372-Lingulodinium_polyedra.AAC.1
MEEPELFFDGGEVSLEGGLHRDGAQGLDMAAPQIPQDGGNAVAVPGLGLDSPNLDATGAVKLDAPTAEGVAPPEGSA